MSESRRLTNPLKWHGGKFYLAPRIVALMPAHTHYVEAFAGGLSVLLAKDPEGVSEVVNDLDRELTNFWRVLQDADTWRDFQRIVEAIPLSRPEFDFAKRATTFGTEVDRAVNFFVLCRQSLAGRRQNFTALTRTRTRRGMNGNVSEWLGAVEGLAAVHERLKRVVVECRPAAEVIRREDTPGTLFYCDPPYLHASRATTGEYAHEMSDADHGELLGVLAGLKGKFLLSGYRSPLYDAWAERHGFRRHDFDLPNHASGGAEKRRMTECVWANY